MRGAAIKLIDTAITHLHQMDAAHSSVTFVQLIGFVQGQIWTRAKIYHNTHFVHAIAYIAWNSTTQGKNNG